MIQHGRKNWARGLKEIQNLSKALLYFLADSFPKLVIVLKYLESLSVFKFKNGNYQIKQLKQLCWFCSNGLFYIILCKVLKVENPRVNSSNWLKFEFLFSPLHEWQMIVKAETLSRRKLGPNRSGQNRSTPPEARNSKGSKIDQHLWVHHSKSPQHLPSES